MSERKKILVIVLSVIGFICMVGAISKLVDYHILDNKTVTQRLTDFGAVSGKNLQVSYDEINKYTFPTVFSWSNEYNAYLVYGNIPMQPTINENIAYITKEQFNDIVLFKFGDTYTMLSNSNVYFGSEEFEADLNMNYTVSVLKSELDEVIGFVCKPTNDTYSE